MTEHRLYNVWIIEEDRDGRWVQRRVCCNSGVAARFIEHLRNQYPNDPYRFRLRVQTNEPAATA